MKIKDVYQLFEGIKVLANMELRIKPGYSVQKNIPTVEAEIKNAEALKLKLFKKYKIEDYNKEIDAVKEDDIAQNKLIEKYNIIEFNKEFNELMEQDSDIKLRKIKIDDLEDIMIKPITLNQLKYIITE